MIRVDLSKVKKTLLMKVKFYADNIELQCE